MNEVTEHGESGSKNLEEPLFFAVNTTAIRLSVHIELPRCINPLFPAFPEIVIKKRKTDGFADGLPYGFDDFVLLKFAV
jgi:hypothetical protein